MLFSLNIPKLNEHVTSVRIETIHAAAGARLAVGARIVDVSVDLSDLYAQDCPPISFHRIVLREALWLRRLLVAPGRFIEPGACIAILADDAAEAPDGDIARPVRIMTAGITHQPEMWIGNHA
jgi:pyruvate/2-oxoglutarate dehydrogenase complex dihydrolipoamide acyltransferase (E2) component